ncbi:haloacid dehalogenase [Bacillus sp. JJ1609]|uniref:HAD family hydrolase n=1 Tax=Bacillus sp. JJ1609 TaxID=3122977 RepID=UPI002FFF7EDE
MLNLTIPGREQLEIKHLVLDFNGTIAVDGELIRGVADRIHLLSKLLEIHVITADTNGSVVNQCSELPISVQILRSGDHTKEKGEFVRSLAGAVCVGNGANDAAMFEEAVVAIAVIGNEGCATSTLSKSDIIVHHINEALDLLLKQNRIIATLRR